MPYSRPGYMQQATATKAVWHGAPVTESNFVGIAVKQKAPSAGAASGTPQHQIAVGEDFNIITKGIVQVDAVAGFAVGDPVYIVEADNTLTETVGSNLKFGRVVYIAGQQGTPTGKVRIDLDKKDSF
jgi:hypothetical protein